MAQPIAAGYRNVSGKIKMKEIQTYFLDASAIVKIFIEEENSDLMRKIFASGGKVFKTTSLCLAESLGVLKCKTIKKNKRNTEVYLDNCLDLIEIVKDGNIGIEEQSLFNRKIYDQTEKLSQKYSIDISDTFQLVSIKNSILNKDGMKCILITADNDLADAALDENIEAICLKIVKNR